MMTVDDDKLVKLFQALDPKQRKKAIKSALTRAAAQVRKQAVKNLKSALPESGKDLAKGIRRVSYKNKIGFRVTIGTKKKKKGSRIESVMHSDDVYHTNRRGLAKPILIWAEGGTKSRHTKTESSWRGSRRKRKGHPTGSMPRYGFMEKTKEEMLPKVDAMLKQEINLSIQRIAKKYGCTFS